MFNHKLVYDKNKNKLIFRPHSGSGPGGSNNGPDLEFDKPIISTKTKKEVISDINFWNDLQRGNANNLQYSTDGVEINLDDLSNLNVDSNDLDSENDNLNTETPSSKLTQQLDKEHIKNMVITKLIYLLI